jgi:hypothetical protein
MATDNFNRADGGLGANWTDWAYTQHGTTSLVIVSNQAEQGGNPGFAFWDADAFADDQSSEVTLIAPDDAGDLGIGVVVRANNGGSIDGYIATVSPTYGTIYSVVANSKTLILNPSLTAAPGDSLRCEAEGTTLRHIVNDIEIDSVTDANVPSGSAGICGFNFGGATGTEMDDWEGGDLGAPAAGQPMSLRRRHLGAQFRPGVGGAMLGYERDGFWRHKLLRTVLARELYEGLKGLGSNVRAKFIDALKRSTRAWLTRKPNLRNGWHIRRCREIWQVMEAY